MSRDCSIDSSSDGEGSPKETFEVKNGNYTYKYNLYHYEGQMQIKEVIGCLWIRKGKEQKQVGTLESYLIQRHAFRYNFYSDADSISQELHSISSELFYVTGKLKKDIFTMINNDKINEVSQGGFLSIYQVHISRSYRGKDLGFNMVKHLLRNLNGRWTFSIICPVSWEIHERPSESEDQEEKNKNICRLFARFGYKQLPTLQHADYWYLMSADAQELPKSTVANVSILLRKRPEKNTDPIRDSLLNADCSGNSFETKLNKAIEDGFSIDESEILHYAAVNGNIDLVKALIAAGASINHCNTVGCSALHIAAGTGNLGLVQTLVEAGANLSKKCIAETIPFHKSVSHINSINCFHVCFNLKPKRNNMEREYEMAFMLMPSEVKSQLIEERLSPRMHNRLCSVASLQADMLREELHTFVSRRPKSREHCFFIRSLQNVPDEVTAGGIYKSFLAGFQQLLQAVAIIMEHGKCLPTKSRVFEQLSWPPNYKYYFEHGGKLKYVYLGLINVALEDSWELGDGSFEDMNEDNEEYFELPAVNFLDSDYIYLETVFLNYLLTN